MQLSASVYHCNLLAFSRGRKSHVLALKSILKNMSKTHPNYKRMNNHDLAIEDNDDENASPSLFLTSSELEPDQVLENEEKNLLNTKLYEVINKLDERSKDIVKSRWLSTSKLTLEDLSKKYGVSRERIRQIENESMLKLKENF